MLSVTSIAGFIQVVKADGETIYIRADGSIGPPTASVNTLDNVTYVLVDNVNEGITVQRSNIIIDGNGHTMDGGNAASTNGLYLSGVNNVMVQNVTISGFYAYGIYLDNSSGNIVTGNKFTTRDAAGIMFNYSDNNILANNTFDGWIGFAGGFLYYSNHNTLYGNYVTGYSFPADAAGGFSLHFSHNNTLIGNDVSGNAQGIISANSDNNTLIANDASWSVSGGPGEAAPWGVNLLLDSSSNNTVLDNNFTNSNGPGVELNSAFNNTLVHNNCVSDSDGIVISSSSGNVLSDNVIKNNNGYVIAMYNLTIGGNGI